MFLIAGMSIAAVFEGKFAIWLVSRRYNQTGILFFQVYKNSKDLQFCPIIYLRNQVVGLHFLFLKGKLKEVDVRFGGKMVWNRKKFFALASLIPIGIFFINAMEYDHKFDANAKHVDWDASFAESMKDIRDLHDVIQDRKLGLVEPVLEKCAATESRYQAALDSSPGDSVIVKKLQKIKNVCIALDELSNHLDELIERNYEQLTHPQIRFVNGKREPIQKPLPLSYESGMTFWVAEEHAYRNWRWDIKNILNAVELTGKPEIAMMTSIPLDLYYSVVDDVYHYLDGAPQNMTTPNFANWMNSTAHSPDRIRLLFIRRVADLLKNRIRWRHNRIKGFSELHDSVTLKPEHVQQEKLRCDSVSCQINHGVILAAQSEKYRLNNHRDTSRVHSCVPNVGFRIAHPGRKLWILKPECQGEFNVTILKKRPKRHYQGPDVMQIAFDTAGHRNSGLGEYLRRAKSLDNFYQSYSTLIEEIDAVRNQTENYYDISDIAYNRAMGELLEQGMKQVQVERKYQRMLNSEAFPHASELKKISDFIDQHSDYINLIRFQSSTEDFRDDVVLDIASSLRRIAMEEQAASALEANAAQAKQSMENIWQVLVKYRTAIQCGIDRKYLTNCHDQINEILLMEKANQGIQQKVASLLTIAQAKKRVYRVNTSFNHVPYIGFFDKQSVKNSLLTWRLKDQPPTLTQSLNLAPKPTQEELQKQNHAYDR